MKGICAKGLWTCAHKGGAEAHSAGSACRGRSRHCARAPRHSCGRSASLHQLLRECGESFGDSQVMPPARYVLRGAAPCGVVSSCAAPCHAVP